jgi:hypothetical protein
MDIIWKGHLKEIKEELPYNIRWHLKRAFIEALQIINNAGGLEPNEMRRAKVTMFPATIEVSSEEAKIYIPVYDVIDDNITVEKYEVSYYMGFEIDINEIYELTGENEDEQKENSRKDG